MNLQEGPLAASNDANLGEGAKRLVNEEIDTESMDNSFGMMRPPAVAIRDFSTSITTRGTQTDAQLLNARNFWSGAVADEYGAAYEGGLYRSAQPNVVTLKSPDTQLDRILKETVEDDDQFGNLADDEGGAVDVEEVKFPSRRRSVVRGNGAGDAQQQLGLGLAGNQPVGRVSPAVLDMIDGLDGNMNGGYKVVDVNKPPGDVLSEEGISSRDFKAEMTGAIMAQKGKRKAREAMAELEDEAVGRQPTMKRASY